MTSEKDNEKKEPKYELTFHPKALKEWKKLGDTVRQQLKKKLAERLEEPRVSADQLRGNPDAYKIKLKGSGYRLVYTVDDGKVVVHVVAIGKRDRSKVYIEFAKRGDDVTHASDEAVTDSLKKRAGKLSAGIKHLRDK